MAGTVFAVLSLAGMGCFIFGLTAMYNNPSSIYFWLGGLIAFYVFGVIGHLLVKKAKKANGKNAGITVVFVLTFLQYYMSFGFVMLIISAIGMLIGVITGKYSGGGSSSSGSGSSSQYVVYSGGQKRILTLTETYKQDYDLNAHYNRFRDDIGYYWRSYDNNKTFVKESVEQTSRGY